MTARQWILSQNKRNIASYSRLRLVIGTLGILLPFLCVLGGFNSNGQLVQNSISHYYHTNMRDVLVSLLGCVSVLFITYSGYGIIDDVVTWVIGLAGAGVAIFPCPIYPQSEALVGVFQLTQSTSKTIHFICAGTFFFCLAINSIFLFTLGNNAKKNRVYVGSGVVILASLAILLIVRIAAGPFFENSLIALIFETIMLVAFGTSWLVKY